MNSIQIQKTNKTKEIILKGDPKGLNSILLGITLLVLLIGLLTIALSFKSFTLILALALIPIFLFVFLLKLFVWQIAGTEKIIIKPKKATVHYDYKYIYKSWSKEFAIQSPKVSFMSIKEGLIDAEQFEKLDDKSVVKIKFHWNPKEQYTCSFSLIKKRIPKIDELISLKT